MDIFYPQQLFPPRGWDLGRDAVQSELHHLVHSLCLAVELKVKA